MDYENRIRKAHSTVAIAHESASPAKIEERGAPFAVMRQPMDAVAAKDPMTAHEGATARDDDIARQLMAGSGRAATDAALNANSSAPPDGVISASGAYVTTPAPSAPELTSGHVVSVNT